ncbi:MAG: helix-turn-helix domain-containing protein [Acidobacteriota bacterium]
MPDPFARFVSARSVFVEDAAALLGVSRRTIYYRIRDGKLATIRTRGGSQRVLVESIGALLRQERRARQVRGRTDGVRALTDGA